MDWRTRHRRGQQQVVVRWNQHPDLPVWGDNPFPDDFAQPLVERFDQNLDTANNFIQMDSTLSGPVSLTPSSAAIRRRRSEGSITAKATSLISPGPRSAIPTGLPSWAANREA